MRHRSLLAFAAVLGALALSACGAGSDSSATPADTSPSPRPAPDRIVSLSPTATETLFAIGAGDQVVAVDDQSNYPAAAPRTKLSGYKPSVEAIAAYDPDLVVAALDPGGLVAGLEKLDVEVILQPAATDLEGAYAQIEALGAASGHEEDAAGLVEEMRAEIGALTEGAADSAGLRVFHEISPDYYSATSQTFIGSIYALLGAENIADEASGKAPDYPQLSAEYILDADPDLIVLSDTTCCGQSAETVAARPGWGKIAAVRDGHVVEVDDDVASRWGPRTVEFVRAVASAMAEAGK